MSCQEMVAELPRHFDKIGIMDRYAAAARVIADEQRKRLLNGGGFNRSAQHVLILRGEEVCHGDVANLVHGSAESMRASYTAGLKLGRSFFVQQDRAMASVWLGLDETCAESSSQAARKWRARLAERLQMAAPSH